MSYGHADKLAAIVAGTQAAAGTFAKAMGVSKVAEMTREHDTRIWRVLEHHVHAARDRQDFSTVGKVGMDETSAAKGQDYVSLFADLAAGRVLFATEAPQRRHRRGVRRRPGRTWRRPEAGHRHQL